MIAVSQVAVSADSICELAERVQAVFDLIKKAEVESEIEAEVKPGRAPGFTMPEYEFQKNDVGRFTGIVFAPKGAAIRIEADEVSDFLNAAYECARGDQTFEERFKSRENGVNVLEGYVRMLDAGIRTLNRK